MDFEPNNVLSLPQDRICNMQSGWTCGFHFGEGLDVIEEDALNEKYCKQALRILITKADTEIDELEKELIFLENDLAWADYDDWSEACCNALTKDLNRLSHVVSTLKNNSRNDVEVPLLKHRRPAKRLHEILKALLIDYFQEKQKQEEIEECCITPNETEGTLKASLMLDNLDIIKVQLVNDVLNDTESNAYRHDNELHKDVQKFDLKVNRNEEGNKTLEASSYHECRENSPKVDKAGGGNADDSFDALEHVSGLYWSRNNCDSSLAVSRKESYVDSYVNPYPVQHATDTGTRRSNSDSALATLNQFKVGNCDVSAAGLRHTVGANERRNYSDSNLNAFRRAKGGYCDINQRLRDLAQKAVHKRRIKESNLTLTGKIESSSSEVEGNRKHFQKLVKVEGDSLTDSEHFTIPSLFEQHDEEVLDITNSLPVQGTMQSGEAEMTETASNDEKFDLDAEHPQKEKAEGKFELNSAGVQGKGFLSIDLFSHSSIISNSKRKLKSGLGSDSPSSTKTLGRKIMKKPVYHHQCEPNEHSGSVRDGHSWPQKKRKGNSVLPIVQETKGSSLETDLPKSHKHPNDIAGNSDPSITNSHSIDSCAEAVASSTYSTSHFKNMKLGDLRTIAKKQKLSKFHKLRKSDLIALLADHLGCC